MASSEQQQAPPSVLATFLALRHLPPCKRPAAAPSAALPRGGSSVGTAATAPPVWKRCTKRAHGERVAALRAALRTPDDGLRDSRDAYNPTKPPRRFVRLHAEEAAASAEYLALTRAAFFEREPVDRDVCDRLENRRAYDARLRELCRHDDA